MIKNMFNTNSGLTLIELMIVLVLSILLLTAVYVSYESQHKTGHTQEQVAEIQQGMRAGLNIIERDIRNAGSDPTSNLQIQPLLAATSGIHALGVQWDSTGAGTASQHIIYYLSGKDLLRNSQVLISNVTSFGISYWDMDGAQSPTAGAANANYSSGDTLISSDEQNVRAVQVSLTVKSAKPDPDTGSYLYRTLTRRIRLRNIRS